MNILKDKTVSSEQEAHALIAEIAAMQNNGEMKLLKGSLLNDPIVDVEFKVNTTGERWSLRGVLDTHGGLTLKRIG